MGVLPKRSATWGLARKLVNIFLRDSLYTSYLRRAYRLSLAERLLEIPLDSITAKQIRKRMPQLPRWQGVRHLDPHTSAAYQAAALLIAKREGVARVHLDAYWWGVRDWEQMGETAAAEAGVVSRGRSKIGAKSVPNWDEKGCIRKHYASGQSSSCCALSASV
jgi:hypothetical protein